MRYSLLSQFQGVLVGAAVGELIGTCWAAQTAQTSQPDSTRLQLPWVNPDRWFQVCASEGLAASLSTTASYGRAAVLGAQSLVQRGELHVADWQPYLQPKSQFLPELAQLATSEMAIASLPIALFFHEDETKLYQKIQQIFQLVAPQPGVVLASFMISWAIAQALRHQFQAQSLIPQLIVALTRLERLETVSPHALADSALIPELIQQLAQVQTLLGQQASLELVRSQLSQPLSTLSSQLQPVLAALYCCLSTPDDWRLAVLRSVQLKISPTLVAPLTGAVSGAANSLAGIPVIWRLALDQREAGTSWLKLLWQVLESESELLELAAYLLATWSGTYDTRRFPVKRYQVPAIAAPRVIRPR